tara:strand:- start:3527 stop:3751 length:225 start_codon:yes stop_codon:yes gene_type:complete
MDFSDTEEVEVSKEETITKNINGKNYIMEKGDDDNCLYDTVTGECVGTYDKEKDEMKPLTDDSDSDSDSDSDNE